MILFDIDIFNLRIYFFGWLIIDYTINVNLMINIGDMVNYFIITESISISSSVYIIRTIIRRVVSNLS